MKWNGFLGLTIFWIFTLISIKVNSSWFRLSEHTFSKLGKPSFTDKYWIFWLGLILGGVLVASYGMWMFKGNKIQVIGGAYVVLSGIFMILIAPVHDGLKPHDTLAFLTFLLFYIGSALFGLGSDRLVMRISQPLILAAAVIGMLFKWKSGGYLEVYGISLVMLSELLTALYS